MEMELMENGLTQEEQAMQPDAVPELEPSGPDVPEPAENEVSEEPPKKKRTSRKKTEKAADDPAPIPGNTLEEGEDLPAPEDASLEDDPLGEGLSQADQLDPEPTAAADGIVVIISASTASGLPHSRFSRMVPVKRMLVWSTMPMRER